MLSAEPLRARHRALGFAVLVVVLIAGCGASGPGSSSRAIVKSRVPAHASRHSLAALRSEANQLLGGGVNAFSARLVGLRGYAVVVNVWASWCPPCRAEFPYFQKVSAQLSRRVAFVGVDTLDSSSAAHRFLAQFPVSYPAYEDPSGAVGRRIGTLGGVPLTAFYDRHGRLVYLHQGPYTSEHQLLADVATYSSR